MQGAASGVNIGRVGARRCGDPKVSFRSPTYGHSLGRGILFLMSR